MSVQEADFVQGDAHLLRRGQEALGADLASDGMGNAILNGRAWRALTRGRSPGSAIKDGQPSPQARP